MRAIVDECIAYRIESEAEDPTGAAARFSDKGADIVTFTSSSTAQYFHALKLPWPDECKAASIGPITTAKLNELGEQKVIQAETHSIDGLVEAIVSELV
jgi:uroporphyrinogen III methyltransferase/synthase